MGIQFIVRFHYFNWIPDRACPRLRSGIRDDTERMTRHAWVILSYKRVERGSLLSLRCMIRALFRFLRKIKFQYTALVEVRIFRDRILHNLGVFQYMLPSGVRIAPVLKSNAYGHGLVQVAECLRDVDIPFLAVDSYYEALVLRNEGIKTPLVVIGYTVKENIFQNKLKDISFTVISKEELSDIAHGISSPCRIHLKIDTGMHRQGICLEDCGEVISLIQKNRNIILEGICTHFADADNEDTEYTQIQIHVWNIMAKTFRHAFPFIQFLHVAATCGSSFSKSIDANVMRLGIGLYGIAPCAALKSLSLQSALEMRSLISSIKKIERGDMVGYNGTYTADTALYIATVPVGYFEGVDRRLSNKGYVIVRGIACPMIGRVSMNIITVDVSVIADIKIGERVVVISSDTEEKNSVENIADLCETIPYEILVHIPASLRRVVM